METDLKTNAAWQPIKKTKGTTIAIIGRQTKNSIIKPQKNYTHTHRVRYPISQNEQFMKMN